MKVLIFIISALFLVGASSASHLLGAKECTWGPSYWCKNLTAAATCHATKHCIQTEWIHWQLPPDNSNICQTCLDMVKQARDTLLSNDTQDLIKQVFEGTCKLIHFKVVVQECDKIVDNFIPDLIDTLASEMNPQVVCSVAGLCNNEKYQKLIEEENGSVVSTLKPLIPKTNVDSCNGCRSVVGIMEQKFGAMSKDQVLEGFLMACRGAGSLSDACSNIVLTYFTEIYDHIKEHLKPTEVCILSGQCSALFHTHDTPENKNVQITPTSNIGFIPIGNTNDDLPCEFCMQLVHHLRDLLTANTTEEEFKRVMEELCKQTKSFSDECVSLVDEYYPEAYQFLVNDLNATEVCNLIGICPRANNIKNIPIAPLLPAETAKTLQIQSVPKKPSFVRVPLTKNAPSIQIISNPERPLGAIGLPEQFQLPIERILNPGIPGNVMYNKQVCEFCQFFLHYVQNMITSPKSEEEIKEIIEKACNDLPTSINNTCVSFVDAYEPALVALMAQEIDPAQICPLIRACPREEDIHDVDVFMQEETGDNSKCPLCLFAVQKVEDMIKDQKTEQNIEEALGKLCKKLSKDLAKECQDFVDAYTDQLIKLILVDMTPKEVCVYMHLCTDKKPAPPVMKPITKPEITVAQIETNSIMDNTFNGVIIDVQAVDSNEQVGSIECIICKKVMKVIIDQVTDPSNDNAVEKVLDTVCSILPLVNTDDCDDFVNKNLRTIINLLKDGVSPYDICSVMQVCKSAHLDAMKIEIFDCPICETAVWAMEKVLSNPQADHEMKHVLEKTCRALSTNDQPKCQRIIEKYGTDIFNLVKHETNKRGICRKIGICGSGTTIKMENSHDRMTILF